MKTLLFAWQCARSDKVRSVLSVVSLTLGVLGLVTVMAANAVLNDTVTQRALMVGGGVSTFRAEVKNVDSVEELERYALMLQVRTGASQVAQEVWLTDVMAAGDAVDESPVDIRFVSENYPQIFPVVLREGIWGFGLSAMAPRAALNDPAVSAIQGTSIRLQSANLDLTVRAEGHLSDGTKSPTIYVPLEHDFVISIEEASVYLSLTGVSLTRDMLDVADKTLSDLGAALTLGEIDRLDTVAELELELETTSQVLLTLGALSIASTMIGTVNMGLVTSKVRSREFALRRVLGASRRQISMVTLLESQIIALIAALFAFLMSWAIFPVVLSLFSIPEGIAVPQFSPSVGALSLGISVASSLLASLVPAVMSFRRDFSQVMRY